MKEIYKSWMDVAIIVENCPITIPMVHNLQVVIMNKFYRVIYVWFMFVYISHYNCIVFVTAGEVRDRI